MIQIRIPCIISGLILEPTMSEKTMSLLKKETLYSSKDYWALPDGRRAELIDGELIDMAPPSRIHQEVISLLVTSFNSFIRGHKGSCKVYPAPFAVNLDAEDKNWVEPDISIICDTNKLTDRGCEGAPDLVVEVVSPSSRAHDYSTKNTLYLESGVREYWIVDPKRRITMVYHYEEDAAPNLYSFKVPIPCGIFPDLKITLDELLSE